MRLVGLFIIICSALLLPVTGEVQARAPETLNFGSQGAISARNSIDVGDYNLSGSGLTLVPPPGLVVNNNVVLTRIDGASFQVTATSSGLGSSDPLNSPTTSWTFSNSGFLASSTVEVVASNTAPTTANFTVNQFRNESYDFSNTNFPFSDTDSGDALSSVTISTVSGIDGGTLYLDANSNDTVDSGETVTASQSISLANLQSGSLKYRPTDNATGTDTFTFTVSDGTDNSSSATATINIVERNHNVVNIVANSASTALEVYGADIDSSGNTYVTGALYGDTDFDHTSGTSTLSVIGTASYSVFVAKYDAQGALAWVKGMGGNAINSGGGHYGENVRVDSVGNVYVSGYFSNTIDLDPGAGTSSHTIDTVTSNDSGFLVKLDSSGNYVWSASVESFAPKRYGTHIAFDSSDNPVWAGVVAEHGTTGGTPVLELNATTGVTTHTLRDLGATGSSTNLGVFISKLNKDSGAVTWSTTAIGDKVDINISDLAVDSSNNAWAVGRAVTSMDFDDGNGAVAPGNNTSEYYFKVSSDGNTKSGFIFNNNSDSVVNSVVSDGNGGVIFGGYVFSSTFDVDPSGSTNNISSSTGNGESFILKLSDSSAFQSVTKVIESTGTGWMVYPRLDVSENGDILLYGKLHGTADFDPSGSTTSITSTGNDDVVVARYASDLSFKWVRNGFPLQTTNLPSPEYPYGDVRVAPGNNVFLGFSVKEQIDLDPGSSTSNVNGTTSNNNGIAMGIWNADATALVGTVSSNAVPTVDLNGATAGEDNTSSFTEGSGAVNIAPSATVADTDNDTIQSITVSVTNVQDTGSEGLSVTGTAQNALGGVSGKTDLTRQSSITLTNGSDSLSASVAEVQTFLRAISFDNVAASPTTSPDRTVTVVINDGTDNSVSRTSTVSVAAVTAASSNNTAFNTSSGANLTPALTFDSSDETLTIATGSHVTGSTAAGAGGTDTLVIAASQSADLTALTAFSGFEALTLNAGATAIMTEAHHDGFTSGITADSGTETITLTTAGGTTSGVVTGDADVDAYTLNDAYTFTLGGTTQDVTGNDAASQTVNIGTFSLTSASDLVGGTGQTDVLQMATGSSIASATTISGFETADITGSVTMTEEQHDGFTTAINASGGSDQITITSNANGNESIIADPDIEKYVLQKGMSIAVSTAGQDVDGSGSDDTISLGTSLVLTSGNQLDAMGGTSDTLSLANGVNTAAGSLSNFEHLTLTGTTATMGASQLSDFTGTITAGGTETLTVSGDGNFSTLANVENWIVGDDTGSTRNITITADATAITADSASDIVTFNVGTLTYTGNLTGNGSNDILQMGNGSNISTATLASISNLTVDSDASVTMTEAQHDTFSSITATGTNQITISAATNGFTANSGVETYVLGVANTVTLDTFGGSLTQTITGSGDNDTVILGAGTYSATLNGNGGTGDTLSIPNNTNVSGSMISNFENLTLTGGGITTMAASQLSQFSGTITAGGSEQLNIEGNGDFNTFNTAVVESYVVGDDSTNTRTVTLGNNGTAIAVTATSSTDAVTFSLPGITYSGTLTGEGTANDTLLLANSANVANATLTAVEVLSIASGGSVTVSATQYSAINGVAIVAPGTGMSGETITINGDGNIIVSSTTVENYIIEDDTRNVRSVSVGANNSNTFTANSATDGITLNINANNFLGNFTANATVANTLEVDGAADISSATLTGFTRLSLLGCFNNLTLLPAQLNNFSGTISASDAADTLTFSATGTVTGGNLSGIEAFATGTGGSITVTMSASDVNGRTLTATTPASDGFTITGAASSQTISGSAGGDNLSGGDGADEIRPGAGTDSMTGGDGTDTFRGSTSELGGDTITDLAAGDIIRITGVNLTSDGSTGQNIVFNSGNNAIQVNTSGDTSTYEMTINLSGTPGSSLNLAASIDGSDTVINFTTSNTLPTFANLTTAEPVAYTENAVAVTLDANVQVSDTELNSAVNNYSGSSLTISRNGGANGSDVFSATPSSLLTSLASGTLTYNGTNFGTVTNSGGSLTLSFTNNSTTAANINSIMQLIQYSNSSDNPAASVTLDWVFNDGVANSTVSTTTQTLINITPQNDAPVLSAAASPVLSAINEDAGDDDGSGADSDDDATSNTNNPGTDVATMVVDASITDADGSAVEAIAVVNADNTNGVWQYSTDNGTNWTSFSGTTGSSVDLSGASRLLDGTLTGANTHKIRFVPAVNYNGTSTITYRAWDKTSGSAGATADTSSNGTTTAFSAVSDSASITINSVNDVPVVATNTGVTVERGSNITLASSTLNTTDTEDSAANVTYTVTAVPTVGALQLSNSNLSTNDTFTQDDIDNSRVRYVHAGAVNTTDSFSFSVADSVPASVTGQNFAITIQDTTAPAITSVVISNIPQRVGDFIHATIVVSSDSDTYTLGSSTVAGYSLGSMIKFNDSVYRAGFTITDGGTDIAAGSDVPVSIVLTDSSNNSNSAFTTAISQGGDAIYANLPDITLTANTTTIAEDGGVSTLTAAITGTLNNQWPDDIDVTLGYSGSATNTADYTRSGTSVTINAGSSSNTGTVTSVADTIFDALSDETVIVDVTTVSVGAESGVQQQTITITDAESAPTVTLSVDNASIPEAGTTAATPTVTLSNATFENVSVSLGYTGTATNGTDYNSSASTSITINQGATSNNAVTAITSEQDGSSEADETVIVDVSDVTGGGASEATAQQVTVTILDDDNSAPTLTGLPSSLIVTEDTTDNIDLAAAVLADGQDNTLTVTFAVDSGTISSPLGTSGSVTVSNSGTTSMTLSGSVANMNSFLDNSNAIAITPAENSTANITLTVTPNDGVVDGTAATSTISVTSVNDNPQALHAGSINFDITGGIFAGTTFTETESGVTMTAVTNGGNWAPRSLTAFNLEGDSILAQTTDLITFSFSRAVDLQSLVFVEADNQGDVDYNFTVTNGTGTAVVVNRTSYFAAGNVVTLPDWTGVTQFTATTAAANFAPLFDNFSAQSLISVSTLTRTFTEDTTGNMDLSDIAFSDVDSASVTLTLTVSAGTLGTPASGASVGGGVTATGVSSTVITLAGSPADINTYLDTASNIQYTPVENANGTGVATLTVTGNDANGSGDVSLVTINIDVTTINDLPSVATNTGVTVERGSNITIASSALSVTDIEDSAANVTYTVTTVPAVGALQLSNSNLSTSDTFTQDDIDNSRVRYVHAGAVNNTDSFSFSVADTNSGSVTGQTFNISIQDTTAPTISAVSIQNSTHKVGDTVTATITVSSDSDTYTLGSSTINGYSLGSLSKTSDTSYTATFTVSDGGADVAATSDVPVSVVLTDSSNNSSSAFTTAISQAGDAIYANIPEITLSVDNNTIAEDGGVATLTTTITGSLNNQWPENIGVSLAFSGTASNTTDYTRSSTTITISTGSSSGALTVTSVADSIFDALSDETVIISVDCIVAGSATVSAGQERTITITDAESAPTVTLSVDNVSIPEDGSTSAAATVTLSNATFEDVTVNLAYSGTATEGTDYNLFSNNVLTVSAGELTKAQDPTNSLTATQDDISEDNETLIIDVDNVSGGGATEVTAQQVTVTIVDDDNTPPTISGLPSSLTVTEDTTDNIDLSATVLADGQDNALTVSFAVDTGTVSSPLGTSGSVTVNNSGTTSMTLSGSVANLNSFLDNSNAVAITPAENSTSDITLTVTPNDGMVNGTEDTSIVTVTPVNDNPTFITASGEFDMTGGSGVGSTTYTETEAGVTMTATNDIGVWALADFGTSFSVTGNAINVIAQTTNLTTISFNAAVDIESFVFLNNYNSLGGTFTFSVTNGTGTDLTLTKSNFTDGSSNVLTPADWTGVQAFTITHSIGNFSPVLDSVKFKRTVSDLTFTEDVAGNIDLSSFTLADVDSTLITLMLTASAGSFSGPADGASVGGGVTETLVSSTVLTLLGSPGDITSYLDTASAIQYTGASNVNGNNVASIQVAANDANGSGNLTLQTINIDISAVNDAPSITSSNTLVVAEDASAQTLALTASDVDSTALTWSVATQGTLGTASVEGTTSDATLSYTPSANLNGTDSVVISVTDGEFTATQTINVTVSPVNDAPLITGATSLTFAEDGSGQTLSLTAVDNDSTTFTWTIVNQGALGSASITGTTSAGLLSYTPTANLSGTDTVTVSVSDGEFTATQAVTVSISPVNDAPSITSSNTLVIAEDASAQTLALTASDVDSTALTWSVATQGTLGTASVEGTTSDATFSYTPSANLNGADSVVISVTDGEFTATQTINVTVSPVNDAPLIMGATSLNFAEDGSGQTLSLSAVDNDSTTFTWAIVNQGTLGIASISGTTSAGLLSYTPAANLSGTDTVTVSVSDGEFTATQAVTVSISPVNDAPVITQSDSTTVTLSEDSSPVAFSLALNATDVDNAAFTWSISAAPSNGSASVDSTGQVSFSPVADFFGNDNFTVSVSDGALSDTIAVDVTIAAVNDAPVISGTPDTAVIAGQSYGFTPSFDDIDSDVLTLSAQNLPAFLTLNPSTGQVSGTPQRSDVGTYSGIILSVSDGADSASLAAFDLQVIDFNAPPVIEQGESTTVTMSEEGVPAPFALTLSATDANTGDTLTWSVGEASLGTVSVSNSGVVTYEPDTNANGTDNFIVSVTDSIDSDSIAVAVTIEPVNDAPVITGEPVTAVNQDTAYSFVPDASDVDGDTLTFSIENVPAWAIFSTSTGALTGTPTGNDVGVTEAIVISVTDGTETASLAGFSLTVVDPNVNVAPVVVNVTASTNEDVAVDITLEGTDANGDMLTYSVSTAASAGSVTIVDNIATFTPTPNANGEDGFAYIASDGVLDSEPATVTISVAPVNDAPVISGQPATQVSSDASYSFTPEASDVENDTLIFSIANMPDWAQFNAETGTLSGTLAQSNVGVFEGIEISVSDGELSAVLGPFSLEVIDATLNTAPVASDQNVEVTEDSPMVITLEATDSDGDVLTFTIEQAPGEGSLVQGDVANQFTYTPNENVSGVTDAFLFSASDGVDVSNTATVTLTIAPVNDAPVITGEALTSIRVNQVYSFVPTTTDVENDTLTFSISNQPRWTSFDANTGALTGTPNSADVATYGNVTISVSDGNLEAMLAPFNIEVLANNAPTISGSSPARIEVGGNYSFSPSATDPDGDTLSFSIVNPPTWASFDTQSGILAGTPSTADIGTTLGITISVSDGIDTTILTPFDLEVCSVCGNVAPTINGVPSESVIEGQTYAFIPAASDANNDNLTFSIINQPAWANFDVNSGTLSGTPGAANIGVTAGIIISVSDGEFTDSLQAFSITVVEFNNVPAISGTPDISIFQDDEYRFTPTATDADGDTLTFSISNQPSWAAFNTRSGTLRGVPVRADVGIYNNIIISVSDGVTSASLAVFAVEVLARNTAPNISGSPRLGITQGEAYSFTPSATDADGDALTFSVTGLPTWLSLDPTDGTLSGTPQDTDVGPTGDIIVNVNDGQATSSLSPFTITVTANNSAPVANDMNVTVAEDLNFAVIASVTDIDGDTLTLTVQQPPQNGVLENTAIGWVYTPATDFVGSDSFVYMANDGILDSANATVNITVSSVNDAPDAIDDIIALDQNEIGTYLLDVLVNDIDVDVNTAADVLTIQGAQADFGVVNIVNNQLSFEPGSNFIGTVVLVYAIRDEAGASDQANVSLTINGVAGIGAPILNVPQAITANATGLFTSVDLGVASATDAEGNPLPVSLVDNNTLFAPGFHTVYWQAEDSFGNTSTDSQNVSVNPLISISKDQVVSEGSDVSVSILLNGDAPAYPVSVNYSVSGTAEAGVDHDIASGSVIFTQGTEQIITFNVLNDDLVESNETIVFALDSNLNLGANNVSTVTISEANIAPGIQLDVQQSGEVRLTVARDEGNVTINAAISDPNPQDSIFSEWVSDNLQNSSNDAQNFTFVPADVATGVYQVTLFASDNGQPVLSNTADVFIEVVDTLAVLSDTLDSDGDLIPDAQEGYADSDGDGIPDYLDAIADCNVVPAQAETQDGFLVESEPGVCMRQGSVAAVNPSEGLEVLPIDVVNRSARQMLTSRGELVNMVAEGLPEDTIATNIGGVFDFILYDLPEEGQTVNLVIPQRQPIPTNAVYRKYKATTEQWADFIIDDNNQVFSAQGERSICPPPGADVWVAGLTEGHWCVQLQIVDGGQNDDDGEANGAIVDPGGVAVVLDNNQLPVAVEDAVTMQWNSSVEVSVLENDTDADGDTLQVSNIVGDFGRTEITSQQTVIYTPDNGFVGTDTLIYAISDGNGGTASSQVLVTIEGNRAPGAVSDSATTDDQTTIEIDVLANDIDVDGDLLTLLSATAESGIVTISENNTLIYTPQAGFDGLDTVTYVVQDSFGETDSGTVSIVVNGNQAPQAMDDVVTTAFETAISVNVLANDMDINGDTLSVTDASSENGQVVINNDNTLTFTPDSAFSGITTIEYTISDGILTSSAVVTVTVQARPVEVVTVTNTSSGGGGAIGPLALLLILTVGWRRRQLIIASLHRQ